MLKRTLSIPAEAGELSVDLIPWSGSETVRIGEQVLSRRRSFRLVSDHRFRHPSDPDGPEYRLRLRGISGHALWRGSRLVSLRERKGLRFLEAFGLSFCGLVVIETLLGFASGVSRRDFSGIVEPIPEGLTALLLAVPLSWWMGRRLRAPESGDVEESRS